MTEHDREPTEDELPPKPEIADMPDDEAAPPEQEEDVPHRHLMDPEQAEQDPTIDNNEQLEEE